MSRVAILWMLAVLTLSGCAGLPDDGAVRAGAGAPPTSTPAPFVFDPAGPQPGATQLEIVAGFLQALQATPVSTRVATEFLTSQAAAGWRPAERTVVYETQRLQSGSGGVTASLDGVFSLDSTGRFSGASGNTTRRVEFGFAREGAEWRIAALPNATVIPRSHFETRYSAFDLHFFDSSGSVLVPEPVYLPRGVQLPTQLVSGLLAGPPQDAAPAERGFLPPGTRLGVGVPVREDGVAEVPLSEEVLALGRDDFERVLGQLSWTLRQVDDVDSIEVTVDGVPVERVEGGSIVGVDEWSEFSPAIAEASTDLFGLRRRSVVQVAGDTEIEAASLPRGFRARSLGVSMPGQQFAVVSSDGTRVHVLGRAGSDGAELRTAYAGVDVLRPMWDRTDRLWLLDRRPDGTRLVVVAGSRARRVPAPGLAGLRPVSAALSRDGTRLVVAGTGDSGPRLVLFRVLRSGRGSPLRLTAPTPLPTLRPLIGVRGLGWRDPSTVAVLSRPTGAVTEVALVSVDASSGALTLGSAPDLLFDLGSVLAASPGGPVALVVASRSGRLHSLDEGGWDLDTGPDGLAAPTFVG